MGGRENVVPSGRRGKEPRRRAKKVAAALVIVFIMTSTGNAVALAEAAFYEASPHVDNEGLIEAGARSYDERLAEIQPERTEAAAISARTLEDAILAGELSPDDLEMPDMMLAGISGDQMALAAAEDDDTSPAGGAPHEGTDGALADADAGAEEGEGPTVDDLAKDASEENPDVFASPALGGDPETIVEEDTAVESPESDLDAGTPGMAGSGGAGVEMASADTGGEQAPPLAVFDAPGGTSPGAVSATDTEGGTVPTRSDELAYTPPEEHATPEETRLASDDSQPSEVDEIAPQETPVSDTDSGDGGQATASYGFPTEAPGTTALVERSEQESAETVPEKGIREPEETTLAHLHDHDEDKDFDSDAPRPPDHPVADEHARAHPGSSETVANGPHREFSAGYKHGGGGEEVAFGEKRPDERATPAPGSEKEGGPADVSSELAPDVVAGAPHETSDGTFADQGTADPAAEADEAAVGPSEPLEQQDPESQAQAFERGSATPPPPADRPPAQDPPGRTRRGDPAIADPRSPESRRETASPEQPSGAPEEGAIQSEGRTKDSAAGRQTGDVRPASPTTHDVLNTEARTPPDEDPQAQVGIGSDDARAERRTAREDHRADRIADRIAERKAERRAERRDDLGADRRKEERARRQRRTERASGLESFADGAAPLGNPPAAGDRRRDAPTVASFAPAAPPAGEDFDPLSKVTVDPPVVQTSPAQLPAPRLFDDGRPPGGGDDEGVLEGVMD